MGEIRWLTADAFREAVQKGVDVADVGILKFVSGEVVAAGGDRESGRSFRFTVSTGARDRDGDIVDVAGWHLDAYKAAGGPVLFAHNAKTPPVAKSPNIGPTPTALMADALFPPRGTYPFADMVSDLVDFGALRTCSPGFRPKAFTPIEGERRGMRFIEKELLEWSITPVPSNPEALLAAKGYGVDIAPLVEWCEEAIEGVSGPGLWVPKEVATRVLKIASGEPVSVSVPALPEKASGVAVDALLDVVKCSDTRMGRALARRKLRRKKKSSEAELPSTYPLVEGYTEQPQTFDEIMAAREEREREWRMMEALNDAVRQAIHRCDLDDDCEELLAQTFEEFTASALKLRADRRSANKAFSDLLPSGKPAEPGPGAGPEPEPKEKGAEFVFFFGGSGEVDKEGSVELPDAGEVEMETKRARMARTGRLPD